MNDDNSLSDEQVARILYSVPEETRNQFVAAALQRSGSGDVSGWVCCREAAKVLLELIRLGRLIEHDVIKEMGARVVSQG